MSEAAYGYERRHVTVQTKATAPRGGFASFLREHRLLRNAAIAAVSVVAVANIALLVITSGL